MRRDSTRGLGACRRLIDASVLAVGPDGAAADGVAGRWRGGRGDGDQDFLIHGILIPSLAQRAVKRLMNSWRTGSKALPADTRMNTLKATWPIVAL